MRVDMLILILILYDVHIVQKVTCQYQFNPGGKTEYKETPRATATVDPNWGYEPYWYNGHWVFKTTVPSTLSGSPLVTYKICGDECSYMIQRMGPVCGRAQSDYYEDVRPCSVLYIYCYNHQQDTFNNNFHTYENYCKLLHAQCISPHGRKVVLVHVGSCHWEQTNVFRNIDKGWQVVSRQEHYVSDMEERFQKIHRTVKDFNIADFGIPQNMLNIGK